MTSIGFLAAVAAVLLPGQSVAEFEVAAKPERTLQPRRNASPLPKVQDILPSFGNLQAHVSALNQRIRDVRRHNADVVAKQKAEYERKLWQQHRDNRQASIVNEELGRKVLSLQHANAKLRREADKITAEHNELHSRVQAMQANLSLAAEFTAKVLTHSGELQRSPDVQVLAELKEREAVEAQEKTHKTSLEAIALLDLAPQKTDTRAPEDIITEVATILQDLTAKQNESEASLKAAFERHFDEGEALHLALKGRWTELNTTMANEQKLNERLIVAVRHLRKGYKELSERFHSLQGFAAHLGASRLVQAHPDKKKHGKAAAVHGRAEAAKASRAPVPAPTNATSAAATAAVGASPAPAAASPALDAAQGTNTSALPATALTNSTGAAALAAGKGSVVSKPEAASSGAAPTKVKPLVRVKDLASVKFAALKPSAAKRPAEKVAPAQLTAKLSAETPAAMVRPEVKAATVVDGADTADSRSWFGRLFR
mmetsp:Transcript_121173/g.342859  ORF Transcript_121173/g.342859 Transcript_121173/m.342859 type:complete len:486 (-) Transcript_121173:124-1581(-)